MQNTGSGEHEKFAEIVIALLEQGAAPWQKPWRAGVIANTPYNPITGTVYKGINQIRLAVRGHDDPRWMSEQQAKRQGWQVKAGSRAALIEHWQWTRKELLRDENGNLKYDDKRKPIRVEVRLVQPRVSYYHVFHASQIQDRDGRDLSPYEPLKATWDPNERAEAILKNSRAAIFHDQANKAFYHPSKDEIHLPSKDNFGEAGLYYSTAMHELGHWTLHPNRLNRKAGRSGSRSYAREELRAEIASWMLAQDLGLSFDPGRHVSYVASWIQVLKDDPNEIVRAASDAEKIKEYLLNMELFGALREDNRQVMELGPAQGETPAPPVPATEIIWLNVSYEERSQARSNGARWDREAELWFAPKGADLAKLAKWIPENNLQIERRAGA